MFTFPLSLLRSSLISNELEQVPNATQDGYLSYVLRALCCPPGRPDFYCWASVLRPG